MPKLYELSEKYNAFNQYMEDALDNIDELDEDTLSMFTDTLESIQDEIGDKVENIVKFLRNIEGDIESYKNEEQRLAKKRKYLENKYAGLKDYTQQMLEFANLDKVQAGLFKVSLRKSPPSVNVLDEKKIPDSYKIAQPMKLDKKTILSDLKLGKEIDGAAMTTDRKSLIIL